MNDIEALLKGVEAGRLLAPQHFSALNSEDVLSSRDDAVFEEKWLWLFNALEDVVLDIDQQALIESLRERAFTITFNATANPELSAYVSDDFEVIGKGWPRA